jgi:hypothetical protein
MSIKGKKNLTVQDHIDEYVMYEPNTGCWIWTGTLDHLGYAKISMNHKSLKAHRVIFQFLKDQHIPEGLFLCHHCDNRMCVNPDHMFVGTHQDNMDDEVRKGRQIKGEDYWSAKLTDTDVLEIRNRCLTTNVSFYRLAKDYDVSFNTVQKAAYGITWKHLPNAVSPPLTVSKYNSRQYYQ